MLYGPVVALARRADSLRSVLRRLWCAALVTAGATVMAATMAAGAVPPAHAADSASEVTAAASALRSIGTMRADFTQTDANGQRVGGVLTLKRGGLIRFQYAPGYPMLIVADGKALTVLDTELKKLQRWPVGNSPLGALLDPGKDVSRFGTVVPGFDPRTLSIEVRDRSHPEYGILTLVFERKAGAPGGLELEGWVTMDAQSRRTVIRLANQHYGVAVSDDLFRVNNPMAGPHH